MEYGVAGFQRAATPRMGSGGLQLRLQQTVRPQYVGSGTVVRPHPQYFLRLADIGGGSRSSCLPFALFRRALLHLGGGTEGGGGAVLVYGKRRAPPPPRKLHGPQLFRVR